MNTKLKVALVIIASSALGAAAVQGLYAQAKSKAYTVTEIQVKDAAAIAVYAPLVQAAIKSAGGRIFNTAGGKVAAIAGAPPPTRVAINEWDNLEQAQVFFKSKAWLDLAPQRDKAENITRLYAVEALPN